MRKHEAIAKMNQLGNDQIPFFFIVDFDMENCKILTHDELENDTILFSLNGLGNANIQIDSNLPKLKFQKHPISFSTYLHSFEKVQNHLHQGNSYLVNLTAETSIDTNFSLEDIFHSATAKYKLLVPNQFVVFSPETFVKINDGIISTYPMKGTIDASIKNAEQIILENKKEQAEHATIVDLLRNDLSRVANQVTVEKFRYIDQIMSNDKNLLQVSSKITGKLPTDYHKNIGSILFKMLPAGSITGAPKKKTVEIIKESETYHRGFYTGVAGYFDGKNMDSFVMIRFIENQNGKLVYKSGGGITSQSIAEDEYQELIDKVYVPIN